MARLMKEPDQAFVAWPPDSIHSTGQAPARTRVYAATRGLLLQLEHHLLKGPRNRASESPRRGRRFPANSTHSRPAPVPEDEASHQARARWPHTWGTPARFPELRTSL